VTITVTIVNVKRKKCQIFWEKPISTYGRSNRHVMANMANIVLRKDKTGLMDKLFNIHPNFILDFLGTSDFY
jgi:hypothetical protein